MSTATALQRQTERLLFHNQQAQMHCCRGVADLITTLQCPTLLLQNWLEHGDRKYPIRRKVWNMAGCGFGRIVEIWSNSDGLIEYPSIRNCYCIDVYAMVNSGFDDCDIDLFRQLASTSLLLLYVYDIIILVNYIGNRNSGGPEDQWFLLFWLGRLHDKRLRPTFLA